MKIGAKTLSMFLLLSFQGVALAAPSGKTLKTGAGHFSFSRAASKRATTIKTWYYAPKTLKRKSPIVFVMHGVKRNAKDYRDSWIKESEKAAFLVIAPEFGSKDFPKSAGYNQGALFGQNKQLRNREEWSFTAIDEIFDHVKGQYGFTVPRYYIYGHSAGAQFVHRLVLFCPKAKIHKAFAANAGWYTCLDDRVKFPYGLKNSPMTISKSETVLKIPLILLLGDRDTDSKHKYLRTTKKANRQGAHRYARGQYFFEEAKKIATEKGWSLAWKKHAVKGVGHSNKGMLKAAAKLIRDDLANSSK